MSEDYIIEVKELEKSYPGVHALKKIHLNIRRGTVHCVVGENGAGKSTFIKILTGAEQRDSGTILLNGSDYRPRSIAEAAGAGISVLYQELNVINQLTVRDNLSLGKERTRLGVIQKQDEGSEKALRVLKDLDPSIRGDMITGDLSVAKKQIVEIAKAIAEDASIIVMDEPTAAISDEEIRRLFLLVDQLKERNVTIIYISHRLDESFRIGDYITVFRDGEAVETCPVSQVESKSQLISMMLGKVIFPQYAGGRTLSDQVVLEASHLKSRVLRDISFQLYQGEVLGFYGLVGAGKSEIARAVYGADRTEGTVTVEGKPVNRRSPHTAVKSSLALVPEERRTEGIFGRLSIRENICLMNVKRVMNGWILSRKKEEKLAEDYIARLSIATDSMEKPVGFLSGGNQQKVVLAKCMNAHAKILMLDEPTRGIDVGAKAEIHRIIRELAEAGTSVMVFSSELQEIMNLCDRIILLSDGAIVAQMKNEEITDQDQVMRLVAGG